VIVGGEVFCGAAANAALPAPALKPITSANVAILASPPVMYHRFL